MYKTSVLWILIRQIILFNWFQEFISVFKCNGRNIFKRNIIDCENYIFLKEFSTVLSVVCRHKYYLINYWNLVSAWGKCLLWYDTNNNNTIITWVSTKAHRGNCISSVRGRVEDKKTIKQGNRWKWKCNHMKINNNI